MRWGNTVAEAYSPTVSREERAALVARQGERSSKFNAGLEAGIRSSIGTTPVDYAAIGVDELGGDYDISDSAARGSKRSYPMLKIERPEKIFGTAPGALISRSEISNLYNIADSIVTGTDSDSPWGAIMSPNMARIAISKGMSLYTVQNGAADKSSTIDLAKFFYWAIRN